MLDIRLIRTQPEVVKAALARRKMDIDIDKLLELDSQKREILYQVEQIKATQNEVSKKIPAMKKAGEDVTPIFAQMKELSEKIKQDDEKVKELDALIDEIMYSIPNIPNAEVPDGDTDEDNVEIRRFMEPTKFDFEPKAHWDVGANLDILDAERAGKVTGARFTYYKGLGARLERAIINFFLDTHTEESGYKEIFPPYMVHRRSMVGTGQLPKKMHLRWQTPSTSLSRQQKCLLPICIEMKFLMQKTFLLSTLHIQHALEQRRVLQAEIQEVL